MTTHLLLEACNQIAGVSAEIRGDGRAEFVYVTSVTKAAELSVSDEGFFVEGWSGSDPESDEGPLCSEHLGSMDEVKGWLKGWFVEPSASQLSNPGSAMKRVSLNVSSIRNWDDFHDLFSSAFKFPYYGRNMNAWIDVMSNPDIAGSGYFMHLEGADQLKAQCPDIFTALIECAAFVNYRCHESGDDGPVIALSCYV